MRKLFGREIEVEKDSKEHVELVYSCACKLKELMMHFCENEFDMVDRKVKEISGLENEADELRRKMEVEFYKGAFLPFGREDRIVLAELVDSVADMIQETAYGICLSRIKLPSTFRDDFLQLTDMICDTTLVLRKCIKMLDVDLEAAVSKAHEVEEKEEMVDRIERVILRKIYKSYRKREFGILTLIELKDTVRRLGNIADRAENTSDRVLIIAAKRRG